MKKMPSDYVYLEEMYRDPYFPTFLNDKIKNIMQDLVSFLNINDKNIENIQKKLDKLTIEINDLQDEFADNDSEIETVARESIAQTIEDILKFYEVPIDIEEATRERDW